MSINKMSLIENLHQRRFKYSHLCHESTSQYFHLPQKCKLLAISAEYLQNKLSQQITKSSQEARRNHNKKTALHFYKNDAIHRASLQQGVGGANNLCPTTDGDNISREKNKQTTHLKRRKSLATTDIYKSEPCADDGDSKVNRSAAAVGRFNAATQP